ncbi:MAG: sigma-54-dependent Fis family transcriptional regulator [Candidatus Pacebacteria bacterium]|nr:sigma-54-dependent Fis family transcriptional regulator [Candidatus Paceibacterota bacterium]
MKKIVQQLDKCLNAESVLILGENGTGKELIAKTLHQRGNRAKEHLSIVDCANLTPEMMQSALFGHVRGAFTGAHTDRKGAFELADGGMVFLDEIGEIPLHLQAGLLRVLQSHRFCRLGGDTEISTDFNLITATNRDLQKMVEKGTFREDLYFRIEQFVIEVPSLRERVDDLVRLASHFVDQYSGRQKMLSTEAEELITSHSWPGNVRELRNCIIRGISYSNGTGRIEAEDLQLRVRPNGQVVHDTLAAGSKFTVMELAERELIIKTLKQLLGNKVASAIHLGIGRQTLYNKIKRYEIADTEY